MVQKSRQILEYLIIGDDSIFKKTYYSLYSTDDVVLLKYLFYNYFFFSNFSYHVVVLHCIFKICILFSFPFPILNQILVLSILNWICLFWNDKLLWPPTLCCCWWVQEILCGFFHHSQHHPSICILFFECCTFFPATHQNCKDGSEHFYLIPFLHNYFKDK